VKWIRADPPLASIGVQDNFEDSKSEVRIGDRDPCSPVSLAALFEQRAVFNVKFCNGFGQTLLWQALEVGATPQNQFLKRGEVRETPVAQFLKIWTSIYA